MQGFSGQSLRLVAAVFGLLAYLCFAPIGSVAQQSDRPASDEKALAAYQALQEDEGYQFERPVEDIEEKEAEPEPPRSRDTSLDTFFAWLGENLTLLGYLIFGIILIAIVSVILRELGVIDVTSWFRRKHKPVEIEAEPLSLDEDAARTILTDADACAAEGRFDEAVHILLYRSIDDLRSQRGQVEHYLTAREIGSLDDLSARSKSLLEVIITMVESSFFGQEKLTEGSWFEARAAYQELAFGGGV